MEKKVLVVSGVNLIDAGPLSVFLDFLEALVENKYYQQYRIIAIVGKKELFERFRDYVEIVEYRDAKKSWLNRIYLEYFGFKHLSIRWNVDTWISMHDTTPNVVAKHRYVYCHNPSPFNKMSIADARFGIKYYIFSKLYKYLYKINIKKNDAIIVQQDWMREKFIEMYHPKEVIVARPSMPRIPEMIKAKHKNICSFVCPSFPRYYKNFEVACEAARILVEKQISNFKLYITLSGNENRYSYFLKEMYGRLDNIEFCGLLSRNELFQLYANSSCMIFMSKLETWGMPITEYKLTHKPMIVADLPYAHETVGTYDEVEFVAVDDALRVSESMEKIINNEKFSPSYAANIDAPYAENWGELCKMILKGE